MGAIRQQKLAELHSEVLKHPAHSSHLAPSYYYVFPNLKKHPNGAKFSTSEDVVFVADDWFATYPSAFYLDGLNKLKQWRKKCVFKPRRDYVE
jgi:hypothetical protein